MAPTYVKIGRCCNSNEFNGIIIDADICLNDEEICLRDDDKFQRDEGNGCRASDYLLGGQEKVAAVRKIFSFEKTMVCGIEKMVCVIQTVFTTTWTTVAPAKKMVSAAQTMV
jgi:hypothetical protein